MSSKLPQNAGYDPGSDEAFSLKTLDMAAMRVREGWGEKLPGPTYEQELRRLDSAAQYNSLVAQTLGEKMRIAAVDYYGMKLSDVGAVYFVKNGSRAANDITYTLEMSSSRGRDHSVIYNHIKGYLDAHPEHEVTLTGNSFSYHIQGATREAVVGMLNEAVFKPAGIEPVDLQALRRLVANKTKVERF